jgi:hypothetical protein
MRNDRMKRIHSIEINEIISKLPEIVEASEDNLVARIPDRTCSLFLCALGFERRCRRVAHVLAEGTWTSSACAFFEYSTNQEFNEINRPDLLQSLECLGKTVQGLACDDEDFFQRLRGIVGQAVSSRDVEPTVLFDISGCSNRLLFESLKILLEYDIRLVALYSESEDYHPTLDEYTREREKWASEEKLGLQRGVSAVLDSRGFPGLHVDQLPDCAVMIPNFRKERALAIIHKIDPSLIRTPGDNVIWLVGIPHLEGNRWRMKAMREINELDQLPHSGARQIEVSTFDYRDCLASLERIYAERVTKFRFWLAPMGSKLQALGAALFCYRRLDVKVVFAVPREYNAKQYSEGCRSSWFIDLGSLKRLRDTLDELGMLKIGP